MFKFIKLFLSILFCILISGIFSNCSNDEESLELLVPTKHFEIDSNGGNINIPLTTNQTIVVLVPLEAQSWIQTRTETSNKDVSGITLIIARSEEYENRSAEILIKGGSIAETIKISQSGTQILTLEKDEYNVSDKGGLISVETKSNFTYQIIMPGADWIKLASTRAVSTESVSFTVEANETYDSRQAVIVFKDNNSGLEKTLTINQAQKDAIVLARNSYEFEREGGIIEVDVASNVEYEIEINCDWIYRGASTRGLTTKSWSFNVVDMPLTMKERSGKIVFTNNETGLSQEISVTQINYFCLQEQSVSLHEEETISLTLINNLEDKAVEWSSSNTSVATVDGNGKITAVSKGIAVITAKASDGKHSASCEVDVKQVVDDVVLGWSAGSTYTSWTGYSYYVTSEVTNNLSESISMNTLTSYDMNNGGQQILSGEINETVAPGATLDKYGISGRIQFRHVKFVWTFTYKGKSYTKEHTVSY